MKLLKVLFYLLLIMCMAVNIAVTFPKLIPRLEKPENVPVQKKKKPPDNEPSVTRLDELRRVVQNIEEYGARMGVGKRVE